MNRVGRHFFWALFPFILQGCAQLQPLPHSAMEPDRSPAEIVVEADRLVADERWSDALELLRRAQLTYIDSPVLQKKVWDIKNAWEDVKKTLEQRILVVEVEGIIAQLNLTKSILKGEPDNYMTKTRLMFWKQALKQKRPDLFSCADYQQDRRLDLAIECLELASIIRSSDVIAQRIDELKIRKKTSEKRIEKKTIQSVAKQTAPTPVPNDQIQALLVTTREAVAQQDYLKVIDGIRKITAIQPESNDYWSDIESLQQKVDEHIAALIRQGEIYYGYDQLEQAVSIWEKVLVLDPNRHDIGERINRARKVLIKYESLKRQQGG